MPPASHQDFVLTPEQLCIGVFVHIDLPWFSHPFSFNSFKIRSAEQLAILRTLGVSHFRYDPDRSDVQPRGMAAPQPALVPPPEPPVEDPATHSALASKQERIARLAQRKRQVIEVEKALMKAAGVMRNIGKNLFARPKECLEEVDELVNQMVVAFLDQPEVALHVMGEHAGSEETYYHGLNCSILSMMLARELGFARAHCQILGVGALLHDIGLNDIPDRVARPRHELTAPERNLRQLHCEYGVRLGRQIGLSEPVLRIIAQHHELADGSGFPQRLGLERIGIGARIVSLVNRYDNLCNPLQPAQAMTPHEALSLLFAQCRTKFDATMLNAFIRMMGVYPPGSVVQLVDERFALVVSVNSSRPLKPKIIVYQRGVPKDEALMLDLEQAPALGIRRSLKPAALPREALDYLSPRQRMCYFFEREVDTDLAEPQP